MNHGIHPSEIADKISSYRSAIAASWALGISSLALLSCLPITRHMPTRSLLSGAALTVGIVAQGQRRTVRKLSASLQDIDDISADSYQSYLYRTMQPATARLEAPIPTEPLPLFDWHALADADEHPIIGIVATMGGGKTILAKYLGRYILGTPRINVLDIYARSNDWKGCHVVTDHTAMLEFIAEDLAVIESAIAQYRTGQTEFPGTLLVAEEGADTFRALRAKGKSADALVGQWLSKYTTVTRKIRRRLCIISVKMGGADFGTGAESRDDCTLIFPGKAGVKKAMTDDRMLKLGAKQNREMRDSLSASLAGLKRPALVYHQGQWYPAAIPDLDNEGNPPGRQRAIAAAADVPLTENPSESDVERLTRQWNLPAVEPEAVSQTSIVSGMVLDETAHKLGQYIRKKGSISRRVLQKNWATNNKISATVLDELITLLESVRFVAVSGDVVSWAGPGAEESALS